MSTATHQPAAETLLRIRRALTETGCSAEPVRKIITRVREGRPAHASGVSGAALAYLLACVRHRCGVPMLIIAKGPHEAEDLVADLEALAGSGVYPFPAWETLPGEGIEPHPDIIGDRFALLQRLVADGGTPVEPVIIVTTAAAISQPMVAPGAFRHELFAVSAGSALEMDSLIGYLERTGYRRADMVEEKGEYSVRGGIADLFPPAAEYPLRIEFAGDLVDTVRSFHTQSQRTIAPLATVVGIRSSLILRKRRRKAL
ncbi:MAG: hypothetical protein NT045_05120 [Candidatus Aureabacteria bacterium]|nr:hypothetical protein [Candidatus Auribacterota bacterium]